MIMIREINLTKSKRKGLRNVTFLNLSELRSRFSINSHLNPGLGYIPDSSQ